MNSVCQGSAADIVKLAMISLHARLQRLTSGSAALILQVSPVCGCCFWCGKVSLFRFLYEWSDMLLFVRIRYLLG